MSGPTIPGLAHLAVVMGKPGDFDCVVTVPIREEDAEGNVVREGEVSARLPISFASAEQSMDGGMASVTIRTPHATVALMGPIQ